MVYFQTAFFDMANSSFPNPTGLQENAYTLDHWSLWSGLPKDALRKGERNFLNYIEHNVWVKEIDFLNFTVQIEELDKYLFKVS